MGTRFGGCDSDVSNHALPDDLDLLFAIMSRLNESFFGWGFFGYNGHYSVPYPTSKGTRQLTEPGLKTPLRQCLPER
jgi:hypothetical protein